MTRLRGSNEISDRKSQRVGERFPVFGEIVAILLRVFSFGDGRLLHLLAVLIEPRQKKDIALQTALTAGDHVGNNLLIGMAEMRLPVDIINRGRDVERLAHAALLWRTRAVLATVGTSCKSGARRRARVADAAGAASA